MSRTRPVVQVTLTPEAIEMLRQIANASGTSRSGALEELVRAENRRRKQVRRAP